MKLSMRILFAGLWVIWSITSIAQSLEPGYIIRQAGTTDIRLVGTPSGAFTSYGSALSGKDILNPNLDNYISTGTGIFTASNDVTGSELNYKPLPPYLAEPYGDLRRGPSHLYSDFVPSKTSDAASYYMYFRSSPANSEALLFRLRMGGIMPGSKGYSILIDTDQKFGSGGPTADPNYVAATTGTNGNPGFELEVVLTTQTSLQTGIALYNVDGTSTPSLVWSANDYTQYSQVSLAGTSDNGDPDFYLDFFVPWNKIIGISALGITTATNFRMIPTTVMSPQAAIGGPKSDIYGLSDGNYSSTNRQFETFINAQPAFTPDVLDDANTSVLGSTPCTAVPTITSATTTTVGGTWTNLGNSTKTTATITLYDNGVSFTTVAATAGVPWQKTGLTIISGHTITASAAASGESSCYTSNSMTVSACSPSVWQTAAIPSPMGTAGGCFALGTTTKGIDATNRTNTAWTIYAYEAYSGNTQNSTTNTGSAAFTNNGTTTFTNSFTPTWAYSSGCSGGSNLSPGTYELWYEDANGCRSGLSTVCVYGTGNVSSQINSTALYTPTLSPTTPTTSTKSITVTGTTGSTIVLYVNGQAVGTSAISGTFNTATQGTVTFSNLNLTNGDSLYAITRKITAGVINSSYCTVKSASYKVGCYATAPVITVNNNNQLTIGAYITGSSNEASGTTIKVYNSGNTLLATTTVNASGSWTTNGATLSGGFLGVAVAGTSYYAQTVIGSCTANSTSIATASSATSNTRCGTITSPATITSATTSLSGALSSSATSTTVNIYLDNTLVGTQSSIVSSLTWGSISVSNLYNGGTLSIGIQETGTEEVICPTTYSVTCNSATTPVLAFSSCSSGCTEASVPKNATLTYTVTSAVIGDYYSLKNATTGESLASGIWATSTSFSITTNPATTAGSYSVKLVSSHLTTGSGAELCSAQSSSRNFQVLPIELAEFKGNRSGENNYLTWRSVTEVDASHYELERSGNGNYFIKIATLKAAGSGTLYNYTDNIYGSNFYRLKLVDNNGTYKYSKTIFLRETVGNITMNTVSPNPFKNTISVSFELAAAQDLRLSLIDAAGRELVTRTVTGVEGINKDIRLEGLDKLPRGIYALRISGNEVLLQQKMVKIDY